VARQNGAVPDPETRARLLDAAWDLTNEVGLPDLTLAEVGARAGVSRQAVYLHFGNRATLVMEMARRYDRTSGFVGRLVATRELPPRDGFLTMLEEWFDYLPTILALFRALEAAAYAGQEGGETYHDRMADWWEAIRIAVARLADDGQLAGGWTIERAADWVWTWTHAAAYHHLVVDRGWTHHDAVGELTATLEQDLLA
jgi:AcrR family transcriptional regulator